jgi:amino acid transporter
LAVALALASALTVFIISYAYSRIIEHFPSGGGGYRVATQLLGPKFGVVSGSALVVDYVLTISVSIASATDQIFSVLPHAWTGHKVFVAAFFIGILVLMNLRGVKESVALLTPIFGLFLLTHAVLIFGGIFSHLSDIPETAQRIHSSFQWGLSSIGWVGMCGLFLRAYAMGGGTYTGIEAVSNGLQIMREPKVETGKRTMLYMAVSLAVTAAGILICYLLFQVSPQPGKTLNAVLLESFAGNWQWLGLPVGHLFVVLALASEAGLLIVAAQAGFIDGPRVMANMANDAWLPRSFAQLSNRLTIKNGVFLMGLASIGTLIYTKGNITALVTMYSINVFLTFSITELSMCRFWISQRKTNPTWLRELPVHLIGFVLCSSILAVVVFEKFGHGGWVTLLITGSVVALCFWIKRHYTHVQKYMRKLEADLTPGFPGAAAQVAPLAEDEPTAVLLVGSYGGLGMHSLLSLQHLFPDHFKNVIFVSAAVVDAVSMQDLEHTEQICRKVRQDLQRYVALAQSLGLASDCRMGIGAEVLTELERLCKQLADEYPNSIFFATKILFAEEQWYQRFLHNETAHQIQRRLQFAGLHNMVLPVRLSGRV